MGLSVLFSLLCLQNFELSSSIGITQSAEGLCCIFLFLLSDNFYSLLLLWKDKLAFCKKQFVV